MQDYNLGPSVSIGAVGDKYDSTATYAVGDYCIKDDKLYVCNTAIETAEAWNASHWTDTTIADVLKTIPVVVDNLTTNDSTKALSAAQGKALNGKIEPQQISDCNSATETGRYLTINSTTNAPDSGHYVLDVIKYSNSEIVQFAQETFGYGRYVRQYYQGTWAAWQGLALTLDTAREYATMWGKTVTAEVRAGFAVLYVNHSYEVRIWLAGTNEIDIAVQYIANNSTTSAAYSKSANNSITFGENSTTSRFTITRNGTSITITTDNNSTLKVIT